ncbi:DUF2079 domain-containing protein [Candidatus Peregrinibacteria bacterium]|nr:DUF2079 domain-containing protein [Candidatus Peregrinibacteria bacterium]
MVLSHTESRIKYLILLIIVFFSLLYGIISLVPHYNFRTNAFDLGIFNQTIHQYSELEFGPNTIREVPTLLADHLEILLFVFAPFFWIFGSYTLLIIQILFVLAGGIGVFYVVKYEAKQSEKWLPILALVTFYSFFGIITALGFDFHNNVIGAMMIPWLFFFFNTNRWR